MYFPSTLNLIGTNPDLKYGPTGDINTRIIASEHCVNPSHGVVEKMTGRRYIEYPRRFGIHSLSTRRSSLMHSRSCSPLKFGRHSREDDSLNRFMFISGRNSRVFPSRSTYAFMPS
jgi:hypothetical protein